MRQTAHRWLAQQLEDPDLTRELELIARDDKALYEHFYRDLSFGTAGMRGILGVGPNRMNIYTVRRATQGLANYLARQGEGASVAIAYDSRHKSELFAREAACVLAANHIEAHLFRELMPTPTLSFAVRKLGCQAGIVVTASHNPAQYNGYKVYGPDGGQMVADMASGVAAEIDTLDMFEDIRYLPYDRACETGRVKPIANQLVEEYLRRVLQQQIRPGTCQSAEDFKIVYTPLCGAGNRSVQTILTLAGASNVLVVREQELPDGDFPSCPIPNPESREAMELALRLAKSSGAHLVLATDPDCDRVGTAVRHGDDYTLLTGNEIGVLLLDYIAEGRAEQGRMPNQPLLVKSIVTTPMADAVARAHGIAVQNTLTGFKYIGEILTGLATIGQTDRFLLGFEESYGYLVGDYARDKDAVVASVLIAEMAAWHHGRGETLVDALEHLYDKHGYFLDRVESIEFEGSEGMNAMAAILEKLRKTPPQTLGGKQVLSVADYLLSKRFTPSGEEPLALPISDVLVYTLEGDASVVVRPSGTEPKLKLYYSVRSTGRVDAQQQFQSLRDSLNRHLN